MEKVMKGQKGFTLIELLIAMAILGAVMAGVFSLYNTQHKVTHIEADVVDVQQNLRMAMDSVLKDIRMSGFMLTGGENPVSAALDDTGLNGSDVIILNTASASGIAARIDVDATATVAASVSVTFTVASSDEVELFNVGDAVRVINPGERGQPANTAFTVSGRDSAARTLTITPFASAGATDFKRGFLIVKTGDSSPDTFPNTVTYCVGPAAGCGPSVTACPSGQNCLLRVVNNTPDDSSVVATNIQDFQLMYVLDGSPSETGSPSNFSLVRDVRAVVRGQTVQTAALSGTPKIRELTGASKIRNR